MERTLTMVKGLGAWMLFFAVFCGAAAALTVTATPPSLNVSPGMNHPVQIFYRGVEASPAGGTFSYSAFSSQGRFEIGAETLLGTVNTSQTLVLVNNRGTATESLVVPARIVKAALELGQGRIFFRRTFQPNDPDISPGSCEVQLQIVPASAGAFSVAQMELEFNRLASSGSTRSGSGGRLTVARNSRGLSATATVSYNGSGTLRGQWKVDGQILGYVTRHLAAGIREATLTSPAVPAFPTYASGLHRVEFEILEPEPAFNEPVIFYYVSDEPPGPPPGSLQLVAPLERERIPLSKDRLPRFSWRPVQGGALYHFQLYGVETPAVLEAAAGSDFSGRKPLVAALTREPFYLLSIFDLGRIVPGIPYLWQVQAFEGETGIAASHARLIYFVTPFGPAVPVGGGSAPPPGGGQP